MEDVEVLAVLTVDEIEARKRRRAESDGSLIDLTALEADEEEAAAVARGKALRAKRAAADAAAAAKKAATKLGLRLLSAAAAGNVDALSDLVRQGADVLFADDHGCTALHFAARNGRVEAIQALLKKAGVSASHEDKHGNTPVHEAITDLRDRAGVHTAFFALVDSLSAPDLRRLVVGHRSALCHAVQKGEELAMQYLVLHGCAGLDFVAVREALQPALLKAQETKNRRGFMDFLHRSSGR